VLDKIRAKPLDREGLVDGIHKAAADRLASNEIESKPLALAILRHMPKLTDEQRKGAEFTAAMEHMDEGARNAPPDPEPPKSDTNLTYVLLYKIDMSEDTRTRVKLNEDAINRYADWYAAYTKGQPTQGELPPPVLFTPDGQVYFIGDGWHRISSQLKVQLKGWPCDVRKGDKWDAIAFAARTDLDGPVPKTKDDRGRTVDMMLLDPVRKDWTNGEIARHCGVSDVTVGNHRKRLLKEGKVEPEPIRTGKGGRKINTSRIGAKKADAGRPTPKTSESNGHGLGSEPPAPLPVESARDRDNESVAESSIGTPKASESNEVATKASAPVAEPANASPDEPQHAIVAESGSDAHAPIFAALEVADVAGALTRITQMKQAEQLAKSEIESLRRQIVRLENERDSLLDGAPLGTLLRELDAKTIKGAVKAVREMKSHAL
jgi:hypothetical protein